MLLTLLLSHRSKYFVSSICDEEGDVSGRHSAEFGVQKVKEGCGQAISVDFPEHFV